MSLRDYQKQALAETWQHFREGRRSVILQLATGAGKTRTAVEGCRILRNGGKRIWWVTHRRELVRQASRAFREAGVYHGIIAAGTQPNMSQAVQVTSIGTLRNRLDKLDPPDIIVWDETRHLQARTWREVYEKYPDTRHWGLDATPMGPKNTGLGKFYEVMVRGPSIGWLMDSGYLCRYRLFTPNTPNLAGVHHRGGEFIQSELSDIMDKPTIVGSAVDEYKKHAHGKNALLYAVSVEASKHAAQQFCDAGYRFVHVDGDTDPQIRDKAIADFEADKIDGICNVSLFTEGTDLKGVRCIIDLAPTESLPRYLQIYGRGLRPDDEPCVFLCHSGNFQRHGWVDDEREWPLESVEKTKAPAEQSNSKECPICFSRYRIFLLACPECNHVMPVSSRVVEQKTGDLVEVDVEAQREERRLSPVLIAQAGAKTLPDLLGLGYNVGRANHVIQAREEKERLRTQASTACADRAKAMGVKPLSRTEIFALKPKGLRTLIADIFDQIHEYALGMNDARV